MYFLQPVPVIVSHFARTQVRGCVISGGRTETAPCLVCDSLLAAAEYGNVLNNIDDGV
jgi:hypothetical protein